MKHPIQPLRRPSRIHLCLALLLAAVGVASAQPHDTKGREFWVTFMSNWGSGTFNESSDMTLFMSSDSIATVKLVYGESRTDTIRVVIPKANTSILVDIDDLFGDIELMTGEERSRKSLHILADRDITLYGSTVRSKSADAFLVLPDDVLTRRYIVLAYPNGYDKWTGEFDMPSQFSVVAIEDGTTVKINPSPGLNINGRPSSPFTVTLDKGEVFFGQAAIGMGVEQDVSGTEVVSNKPIAIFAGVKRTSIPTSVGNYRDNLVEQMPPLEVWGKEAVLTPHYVITPNSPYPAVARILAAFDNTTWSIDGVPQGTLPKGRSVEIELRRAMHLTASQPFMVAQYEHSVDEIPGQQDVELGDPFFMIVPPSEQFDTAYAFQSVPHAEFVRHFINVVIPTSATGSVMVDGQPLNAVSWNPVPTSNYSFAQIEVTAGSHFIRADEGFGLYSYGFGGANSYGYTGGMLFRTLVVDYRPPLIETQNLCARVTGFAFDSHITDSGIDSLYLTPDTSNVRVTIDSFKPGTDTVRFAVDLVDPYQDGIVGFKAIDSGGRSFVQITPIPGYTLRTSGMEGNTPILVDTFLSFNGKIYCRNIEIENYGRFPQTIDSLDLESDLPGLDLTVRTNLPLTIAPGGRASIAICSPGLPDTVAMVRMKLMSSCLDRDVALIPIAQRVDTNAPSVIRPSLSCGDELHLIYTENTGSGIQDFHIDTLINAEATITPDNRPTGQIDARLRRLDYRRDVIYQVALSDRAGNTILDRDTIGGYTIAAINPAGQPLSTEVEARWNGDTIAIKGMRCDSVILSNYGLRPITIASARMFGNSIFSIPPSQFPIVVQPGEERRLGVCIEGRRAGEQIDTLSLVDSCGHVSDIAMKVPVTYISGVGLDNCNNALAIQMFAASKRTFLEVPLPNPADGTVATVDMGLVRDESVSLEIFDANGNLALTVMRGVGLEAGVSRITFDLSALESGSYFCRMTTATGEVQVQKMMVRR